MFDLKVWLDDYMEFLEQEEEQEQLEKVCRKLLKLFAWQKASPSDIRFRLASSMLSLNKKKRQGISARDGMERMRMTRLRQLR